MSVFWWVYRWIHIRFILRELTSICVAAYVVVLLFYVRSVLAGPEAFEELTTFLQSPLMIGLHVTALGGLIFHSITWFNLAPKALVVKIGERNVPGTIIVILNYGGWVVVSLVLTWLLLKG